MEASWCEVDSEELTQLFQGFRCCATSKESQQVFLTRLPENHPVDRQRPLEALQLLDLAAERDERDEALYAGGAVIDPERLNVGSRRSCGWRGP